MKELLLAHPSYAHLAPILLVVAAGLAMLALDLVIDGKTGDILAGLLGVAALAGAACLSLNPLQTDLAPVTSFVKEILVQDAFARYFNLLFIAAGALVIIISFSYKPTLEYLGEFFALIVICTSAFMFLASSVNILMIYLCIEFVGITCYVLAAYRRGDPRSGEGAIKYLLMGGVASAFMVYGMSLLYGFTGSLNIHEIGAAYGHAPRAALFVAFLFTFVGFGFKIALFPFHQWAPDAYEGAPTPVTAFFSVAPKAAGLAVLLRAMIVLFPVSTVNWVPVLTVLAIGSMLAGNIIALWQTNVKRMLAYSGIAHIGYMMIGLITAAQNGMNTEAGRQGVAASMIYVTIYVIMNIGAFAAVIIASNNIGSDDMGRYNGLGKRMPFVCVCLTFFMLSLAGIPPTAGFIGKLFLFMSAINTGAYVLAFSLAANSVISVYYYWMLVRRMFIEKGDETEQPAQTAVPLVLVLSLTAVVILALGLFFQPLMNAAARALPV